MIEIYEKAKRHSIWTLICYCFCWLIIPIVIGWVFNTLFLFKWMEFRNYIKDSNVVYWTILVLIILAYFFLIPALINVILIMVFKKELMQNDFIQ